MKNIFFILTLILCNSTFSSYPPDHYYIKRIAIGEKVGDAPLTMSSAIPYTDQVKMNAVNRFYADPAPDNTLVIRVSNHEKHESLTEYHGENSFDASAIEFAIVAGCPKLTYAPCPKELSAEEESVYYIDYATGTREGLGCDGLGRIRKSLKLIKVKKYFVTDTVLDCIFLTVFNRETAASFNTHINYIHFADEHARDFETFSKTLLEALESVLGSSEKDSLQITLISSYLSTGMKTLYEMMSDYITPENVQVDFGMTASNEPEKPYIIRKVGAANTMIRHDLDKKLNASHIAWTRPVEVYLAPSTLWYTKRPGKKIVFNAVTGEHSFL